MLTRTIVVAAKITLITVASLLVSAPVAFAQSPKTGLPDNVAATVYSGVYNNQNAWGGGQSETITILKTVGDCTSLVTINYYAKQDALEYKARVDCDNWKLAFRITPQLQYRPAWYVPWSVERTEGTTNCSGGRSCVTPIYLFYGPDYGDWRSVAKFEVDYIDSCGCVRTMKWDDSSRVINLSP